MNQDWFTLVYDRNFADKRSWDFRADGGVRLVVDSAAAPGNYILNVSVKSGKYQAFTQGSAFKVVSGAP